MHAARSVAKVEQMIGVLQFVFGQPARVGFQQQREVMEFVAEFAAFRKPARRAREVWRA